MLAEMQAALSERKTSHAQHVERLQSTIKVKDDTIQQLKTEVHIQADSFKPEKRNYI